METPTDTNSDRTEAFSFATGQAEFSAELTEIIMKRLEKVRSDFVAAENSLSYSHGTRWLSTQGAGAAEQRFSEHRQEAAVKFDDIVSHNLAAIPLYLDAFTAGLHKQFVDGLFQMLSDACERTGNVVNAKEVGSPARAYLELLKKIQFGVDHSGKPSLPQFHLGGEAFDALQKDIAAQGPEFQKEVEGIVADKMRQALDGEAKRRARFRTDR